MTEEKEKEKEEEEEERPTGNRSHFSQLRPRDSRQGSLQTGEICNTIAQSNTILCMLMEGEDQDGTNAFIILRSNSFMIMAKYQLVSRSHSRITAAKPLPLTDSNLHG